MTFRRALPRDAPARIPAGRPRLPPSRSAPARPAGAEPPRTAAHRAAAPASPVESRLRRGQDDVFGLGRLLVRAPLGRRHLPRAVTAAAAHRAGRAGRCSVRGAGSSFGSSLGLGCGTRVARGANTSRPAARRHRCRRGGAAEGRQARAARAGQHRHAHGTRTQGEPRPAERRDQVGLICTVGAGARTLNLLASCRGVPASAVEPIQVDQKCQPVEQRGRHALLMHAFIQSHQAKPCLIGDPQALALTSYF